MCTPHLITHLHICAYTCVLPTSSYNSTSEHTHVYSPHLITHLHICAYTYVLTTPSHTNKKRKENILLTKWACENTNKYTLDNGKCLDVSILKTWDHSFPEQLFLRAKMSPQNCTSSLCPFGVRNRALLSIHFSVQTLASPVTVTPKMSFNTYETSFLL